MQRHACLSLVLAVVVSCIESVSCTSGKPGGQSYQILQHAALKANRKQSKQESFNSSHRLLASTCRANGRMAGQASNGDTPTPWDRPTLTADSVCQALIKRRVDILQRLESRPVSALLPSKGGGGEVSACAKGLVQQ